MSDQHSTILQALDAERENWIKLAGVVGMGIGQGQQGLEIRVFVESEHASQSLELPTSLAGFPVVQVVSGRFTAGNGE